MLANNMGITSESWSYLLCSYMSCDYFGLQLHLWILRSGESLAFKCCVAWLRHYQFHLFLGFYLVQEVHVVIAGGLSPMHLMGMIKTSKTTKYKCMPLLV